MFYCTLSETWCFSFVAKNIFFMFNDILVENRSSRLYVYEVLDSGMFILMLSGRDSVQSSIHAFPITATWNLETSLLFHWVFFQHTFTQTARATRLRRRRVQPAVEATPKILVEGANQWNDVRSQEFKGQLRMEQKTLSQACVWKI